MTQKTHTYPSVAIKPSPDHQSEALYCMTKTFHLQLLNMSNDGATCAGGIAHARLLPVRGGSARHRHLSRAERGRKTSNAHHRLLLADCAEALHSYRRQHQGVLDSELVRYEN